MSVYDTSLRARFFAKVDENGPEIILGSPCHVWTGTKNGKGYGLFRVSRSTCSAAHRVAWAIANDMLPPRALHVCHRCDNPPCVRGDHLFLGDDQANMDDMKAKGRAPVNVGERNPNARLTLSEIERIRELRAEGMTLMEIAAVIGGISFSSVSRVLRGQTWSHLQRATTSSLPTSQVVPVRGERQ